MLELLKNPQALRDGMNSIQNLEALLTRIANALESIDDRLAAYQDSFRVKS